MGKGTALVTGASSGIGLEMARELARRGYDLALAARSADRLSELARACEREFNVRALPIPVDLASPGAAARVVETLAEHNLAVDVLINNAGFATFGPFSSTPLDEELGELQLNVVTLTALTKLLLPAMIIRGSGRILNVASTAAFVPGPFMAVYYATKAYVLSFSQALAEELRGSGVTVTCLCPGATASGFAARAGLESSLLFRLRKLPSSAAVALYGIDAMERGTAVAVHGFDNKAIPALARLLGGGVMRRAVRTLQTPVRARKRP